MDILKWGENLVVGMICPISPAWITTGLEIVFPHKVLNTRPLLTYIYIQSLHGL